MKFNFGKNQLLAILGLFWLGLLFLSLLMTIIGLFYGQILTAYLILGSAVLFFIFGKNWRFFYKHAKFSVIIIISLLFVYILSSFVSPTIFSGRDQGSFSEAAIRLSQKHQLKFSFPASREFFNIYGPGKALNFPGFNYTADGQLITHFPIGYISWLASFYSIFGLSGLVLANGITLFLFLIFFFSFSRIYLKTYPSFVAWLLVLTSFVFSWFFKFTLSENLALFLFWFGLWNFSIFMERKHTLHLSSALLSFLFLAFTRIEGLAFLAIAIFLIRIKQKSWNDFGNILRKKWMAVAFASLIVLYLFSFNVNYPFYLNALKGLFGSLANTTTPSGNIFSFFYVFKVLFVYAIFDFVIIAFIALFYALKNKHYENLFPLLISSPAFLYLINPSISSDHPWMLRRFVFTIVPVSIFYSVWLLDKFFERKRIFFHFLSLALLIINLFIFIPYFPVKENQNLLAQTEEMSRHFSSSDLVLMDREASGSGWSMMAGPLNFLYGKQAVYFFNSKDLEKIKLSRFSNVYLVVPDKNIELYEKSPLGEKMYFQREYRIETTSLNIKSGEKDKPQNSDLSLPESQKTIIYGKIYMIK
ncbi:MAG TPA: hypothetical protein PLK35_00225 [Candidatus Moranbacteria bacterium]|mgnify:CR=1 FL=1|nr:hypothetical protein [Candidatus Moranbacteria bacterium]